MELNTKPQVSTFCLSVKTQAFQINNIYLGPGVAFDNVFVGYSLYGKIFFNAMGMPGMRASWTSSAHPTGNIRSLVNLLLYPFLEIYRVHLEEPLGTCVPRSANGTIIANPVCILPEWIILCTKSLRVL
jgi:hypothetical protein